MEDEEGGLLGRISFILVKIESGILDNSNDENRAKTTSLLLKELRTYVYSCTGVVEYLEHSGFLEKIVSLFSRAMKSRILISELMRCITSFARIPELSRSCHELMQKFEIVKPVLASLRRYSKDPNIQAQASELIYGFIGFITESGQSDIIINTANSMVMYGGTTTFPQMLHEFVRMQQRINLKRVLTCKKLLVFILILEIFIPSIF
jgi:hypothetical protein